MSTRHEQRMVKLAQAMERAERRMALATAHWLKMRAKVKRAERTPEKGGIGGTYDPRELVDLEPPLGESEQVKEMAKTIALTELDSFFTGLNDQS